MSWNVPPQSHQVFERNPLVAVLVEVRFHPILKIVDRIADIQDLVRGRFPGFQRVRRQVVNVQPTVELRDEELFVFSKPDDSAALTFTTSTLTVECRLHEERANYLADAQAGLDALTRVCGEITPTRLGLRYVDIIDKARIENDLGRGTSWSALVAEPFMAVPTGLASFDESTFFAAEVASTMPIGGQVLRYGLTRDADQTPRFRFDVDRYLDNPGDPTKLGGMLESFANDIFSVFVAAMGPDLKLWMPVKDQR